MVIAVTLEPAAAAVVPGTPLELTLTVRNDSEFVQQYLLSPVGALAPHVILTPDRLSVYPGRTETATVRVLLPRTSDITAEEHPLGVRVVPAPRAPAPADEMDDDGAPARATEDAETAEAMLTVEPFVSVNAELVPAVSRSRGRKRVRLAVDNNGNAPLAASLIAQPNDRMRIAVRDPEVSIEPGRAQFVSIVLRPRRRIWRGSPASHQYSVVVAPHGDEPVVAEASHLQDVVFPSWFWKALLALAALIALLILLWHLLLKPTIEDTAREAIVEPLAAVQQQAESAQQAAEEAQAAAEAAQQDGDGETPPPTPPAPEATAEARTYPVTIAAGPGANAQRNIGDAVPDGSVFEITDIVFNNPQGDIANLRLVYGTTTLLSLATENYRDLDLHFVTPIQIPGGQTLTGTLTCITPGQPTGRTPTQCAAGILITGAVVTPPPAE